jgi:hypothetical protein
MYFINDVDLVFALHGDIFYLFPKLPDIIYSSVRGAVDLKNVHGVTGSDGFAAFTFTARVGSRPLAAVEAFAQYSGGRCLADPSGAGK